MPRHPSIYADMLAQKIEESGAQVWLLNTGWIRGGYGEGERISIKWTRRLLNACLDGTLSAQKFERFERFNFEIPTACPGVPSRILHPRKTWDEVAYMMPKQTVLPRCSWRTSPPSPRAVAQRS